MSIAWAQLEGLWSHDGELFEDIMGLLNHSELSWSARKLRKVTTSLHRNGITGRVTYFNREEYSRRYIPLSQGRFDGFDVQRSQDDDIQLPKNCLPKFDCEITSWSPFLESFQAHVHNRTNLSPTTIWLFHLSGTLSPLIW